MGVLFSSVFSAHHRSSFFDSSETSTFLSQFPLFSDRALNHVEQLWMLTLKTPVMMVWDVCYCQAEGRLFFFAPIAPHLIFSLFSKHSILFANFWMVSKRAASVSGEGLGVGDASVVFAGGAVSSMSAGGWLFSLSVGDRVSWSKSH